MVISTNDDTKFCEIVVGILEGDVILPHVERLNIYGTLETVNNSCLKFEIVYYNNFILDPGALD